MYKLYKFKVNYFLLICNTSRKHHNMQVKGCQVKKVVSSDHWTAFYFSELVMIFMEGELESSDSSQSCVARSRSLARWDLHTDTSLRLEDAKPLTGGEQRRTSRWRLATWCVVCSLQSPDSHSQVVWPSAELGWPAALARRHAAPELSPVSWSEILYLHLPTNNLQYSLSCKYYFTFLSSL